MKNIFVLGMVVVLTLAMGIGFAGAQPPGQANGNGPSEQGIQNQKATENVPEHANANLPFDVELESVVYEGTGDNFGSNADDVMTFTFSNNVYEEGNIVVYFEEAQKFKETWGKADYEVNGDTLTVTTTEEWKNPRPVIGDYVTEFESLVDSAGNSVVVPDNGVEVEEEESIEE